MNVGVQVRVTIGDGAFIVVGEIVAIAVFSGVVVPVNVDDGPVVGTRVVVLVDKMVGLGSSSVAEGLVGLDGGCVVDRLVGFGVFVWINVGEGATVCVVVAT
jgi:hypothetical protein